MPGLQSRLGLGLSRQRKLQVPTVGQPMGLLLILTKAT
jgi:hypothetical protein